MNKYEILGQSGEGAYGVVLKCRNKESNALVAVKKFKDLDDPDDIQFRKTTLREIKLLKNAVHPNIVKLIEAFKRKQRLYLVFEYCESTILELLEKSGGMMVEDAKFLAYQILRATDFLHQNHIIHRDLKPENLLVTNKTFKNGDSYQIVKICDFGFARHVNAPNVGKDYQPQDLTSYVATRWYRAPELLLNSQDYNSSVDVWAIALIIVEMITSQPLFPGDSDVDQLYLIQKVLGNMTRKQMEKFLRNPKFIGLKMPDQCGRVEGLERRLSGKIRDKKLLYMLENMLKMEPSQRWTAEQCLQSEWFDSVRQKCLEIELELYQEMGMQPNSVTQVPIKNEDRSSSAGVDVPKAKSRNKSRDNRRSVSPIEHFHNSIAPSNLISIGVPADLPQLPASKSGSRGMAHRTGQNISIGHNYGYGHNSFNTKGTYGLPGLPKYK